MEISNRKLIIEGPQDNGDYVYIGTDAVSGNTTKLSFSVNIQDTNGDDSPNEQSSVQ